MAATSATEAVSRWLERPTNRVGLEKIVRKWNELELLGVDLADQLRELVRVRLEKEHKQINLDAVDWWYLAEHYAFEICGVTEEELTRRRESQSES